jgi:hypothetical protein
LGWFNIYSSSLRSRNYDTSQFYGKQLINILLGIPLIAWFYQWLGRFSSLIFDLTIWHFAGLANFRKNVVVKQLVFAKAGLV